MANKYDGKRFWSQPEVHETVLDILNKQTGENVTLDTNFNSLGFDSLDEVEFIMELEKRFDIAIADDIAEIEGQILLNSKVSAIFSPLSRLYKIPNLATVRKDKIKKINKQIKEKEI